MGHRQLAPAFFSMAERPAPPAPVVPVVVAEESAAGVVPADAELQPPPVVEAEVFLLIVFGFPLFSSACFGPLVFIVRSTCFVSRFSLPVRIYPFQFSRFLRSSRIFYSWLFIVLYTFVLLCTLPVLRKFFLHCPVYLLCLARIFLSWVFVALRFVCEIQGFFIVFCTFCLRVCKFPVFSKFGDTAL